MRPILVTVAAVALVGGCSTSSPRDASPVTSSTGVPVTSASTAPSPTAPVITIDTTVQATTSNTTAAPVATTAPTAATTAPLEQGDEADLLERFRLLDRLSSDDDLPAVHAMHSAACRAKYSVGELTLVRRSWRVAVRNFGLEPDELHNSDPEIDFGGHTADLTYELLGADDKPVAEDQRITATWIFENGEWVRDTCDFDDTLAIDRSDSTLPGTRSDPIMLGDGADIGSQWSMKINSVDLNATEAVLAADPANKPPADGMVYVLANISVFYAGREPSETGVVVLAVGDGTDTVMLGGEAEGVSVTPEPAYDGLPMSTGEMATGNVVIEVPAGDIDTLVLIGQPATNFGDDTYRVFFAAT